MNSKTYINNDLHLARDYADICPQTNIGQDEKRTVFRESEKTASFEEKVMYNHKYSGIFSRQMEAVVLKSFKYFSLHACFENWGAEAWSVT